MKILVITQHYPPEPFAIGDICQSLANRGNEVTVITGIPNYPEGNIYQGYEKGQRLSEEIGGVHVHRCRIIPRKTGVLCRFLNYLSFERVSVRHIKKMKDAYDAVFVYQSSPVMMAKAGVVYKKKFGKRLALYCLDLWPESLCSGGISRQSLIYKFYKGVSKRIYQAADTIFISSQPFADYLNEQFHISRERISYLPQYAGEQLLALPAKIPSDCFSVMFAGNIGKAQDMNTVIEAANYLQGQAVKFHIVGDGSELAHVKELAKGLSNVIFYGRKPAEQIAEFYCMADAMLVSLMDDPMLSQTVPAKVQSYMAAGKPIVGAINGETLRLLSELQGGYCVPAGNAKALADAILRLRNSKDGIEIGNRNRAYYLENFSKQSFMNILERELRLIEEPV